jgi:sugar lactone lactonase YvrE
MKSSHRWAPADQSSESGQSQVYLTRFPHPGAKYQVSKDGGTQPVWSKDGKTLYYIDSYRKLTAVDIQMHGQEVQIGAAKPLFTTRIRHSIATEVYDVARDGRFLVWIRSPRARRRWCWSQTGTQN